MHPGTFSDAAPGRLIPAQDGYAFLADPLPPDWAPTRAIRETDERALLALGELRAVVPMLPAPELVSAPFLRREAVFSSRIEGTRTEISGLYLFEMTGADPAERERPGDARIVANYVRAMKSGLADPLGPRLWTLRRLHEMLFQGIPPAFGWDPRPGQFRDGPFYARLGGSDLRTARFVPAPPSEVEFCMRDLEGFLFDPPDLPTLVRAAIAHYQFEAIHPFHDGNGRIGRLLIPMLLKHAGLLAEPLLYLSAYFERDKSAYIDAMWEVSRAGDWDGWVSYFLEGVVTEAGDAARRARTLLALRERWRDEIQAERSAASLLQIVDALFRKPVVTNKGAAEITGLSRPAATGNVEKLAERGWIEEVTGNARNKVYRAPQILRLLE